MTLIELMIVVIIVGVLAGIAYPSYRNYLSQTNRSDAQIILTQIAARQEKFYSDCSTYASVLGGAAAGCATGLGLTSATPASPQGYYTVGAPEAGNINGPTCERGKAGASFACGFTLTATPVAGKQQAADGALRIDAIGTRQWNRKNSGTWVGWTSK